MAVASFCIRVSRRAGRCRTSSTAQGSAMGGSGRQPHTAAGSAASWRTNCALPPKRRPPRTCSSCRRRTVLTDATYSAGSDKVTRRSRTSAIWVSQAPARRHPKVRSRSIPHCLQSWQILRTLGSERRLSTGAASSCVSNIMSNTTISCLPCSSKTNTMTLTMPPSVLAPPIRCVPKEMSALLRIRATHLWASGAQVTTEKSSGKQSKGARVGLAMLFGDEPSSASNSS
mmetsp:Transcript_9768/g.23293  ORF Transcript_9768/g.23293 Transcript_9768/m.23293 type:complete len:229 (-) Transcript_9768:510-1196(-)